MRLYMLYFCYKLIRLVKNMKATAKPLVSIIIPCYNGSKTIRTCLDSVLAQTYKNLEVITVDDGSTDDTARIIQQYEDSFAKEGMVLRYIYQENKGLGGAIDTGLKIFSGDFLCWIDCDDFLMEKSVETRLDFLLEHTDFGCVSSNANIYNSDNLTKVITKVVTTNKVIHNNPHQFLYMLKSKSIFCPGCHMIRTSAFLEVNPDRKIFPARRGQNWQLLLPVYYKHKRGFIDEPLYGYVIYPNSMSRGDDTKEKKIFRFNEHLEIITNTLNRMIMPEKDRKRYMRIYKGYYYRQMYGVNAVHKCYKEALKYFALMFLYGELEFQDIVQIVKQVTK